MATRPTYSTSNLLNAAQLAINNSLGDAEIQDLVAAYGYSATRLNEGKQLHDTAVLVCNAQAAAAGAQREATARVKAAEKDARDAYQALAQVARATLRLDKAQLATLGIVGSMPKPTAGFLAAGYLLFDNALAVTAMRDLLAGYGYDQARLQSERAKIVAFDQANQAQEAAKGAAQQATRDQEAVLATLGGWLAQYKRIVRVALRGKKELLEKLGLPVRSRRPRAKRKPRVVK